MIKEIIVTSGKGEGTTEISAFDAALFSAGIADFNLIFLSSIIPKMTRVIIGKPKLDQHEQGSRLYVVLAKSHVHRGESEIAVGLGWSCDLNQGGVFAESVALTEKEVEIDIRKSLSQMSERRGLPLNPEWQIIRVSPCDHVSCGIVAAVFCCDAW